MSQKGAKDYHHSLNKEKSHDMTTNQKKNGSTAGLLSGNYNTQLFFPASHPKLGLHLDDV
jgi:hypothetical protein